MMSDLFQTLSNLIRELASLAHVVTTCGLLLAILFAVLYLTRRKPEFALLCLVSTLYAFAPLVPYATNLMRH